MRFISLEKSSRKDKKYVITFDDKIIHFGSKNSNTFLDHKDEKKRLNYLKRHQGNEHWDSVNAGSLSRYLLWDGDNIYDNVKNYLKRFGIDY